MTETTADQLKAANVEAWRMIRDKEARREKTAAEYAAYCADRAALEAKEQAERHAQRLIDLLDGEAEPLIQRERTRFVTDEITLLDFEQRVETILADQPRPWELAA